ncbi:MAG: metallophosphoesterase family protein [Candidatus Latescibacterota bacterium]
MNKGEALRIAHMTDVHVQPECGAGAGLTQALAHMRALERPPQLLLTGGDAVMNATGESEARVATQWQTWHGALTAVDFAEVFHCLGNHDAMSWHADDGIALEHKRRAMTELAMPGRYYSFAREGWHFIMLDSCQPLAGGYTADLDAEQWQWLEAELEAAKDRHVLIVSHVPILSVTGAIYDDQRMQDNHWQIPGDWMHTDAYKLQKLFQQHPHVRLCLSGHMHLRDRCEYNGVTYICNGALCAGWWGGDLEQCDEGYGLIDLYADGSFDYAYETFCWQPRE